MDHFLSCESCKSAWLFFWSKESGPCVDRSMLHRPKDFSIWLKTHESHGIRVLDRGSLPIEFVIANYPERIW